MCWEDTEKVREECYGTAFAVYWECTCGVLDGAGSVLGCAGVLRVYCECTLGVLGVCVQWAVYLECTGSVLGWSGCVLAVYLECTSSVLGWTGSVLAV